MLVNELCLTSLVDHIFFSWRMQVRRRAVLKTGHRCLVKIVCAYKNIPYTPQNL
jgi:hypothetical protein